MIRRGTLEDLARVVELERGAATAPHWGRGEYEGMFQVGEELVKRVLFVAEVDGLVEGFAVGRVVDAEGELESVVVLEARRRAGHGEALCAAVLAWCREEMARSVMLEVRVGSAGAIRLYERLGFVELGCRKEYYFEPVEDALVMRWTADGLGGAPV